MQIYNFETNSWSFGPPLQDQLLSPQLFTDPYGGVMLYSGPTLTGILDAANFSGSKKLFSIFQTFQVISEEY